LIADRVFLAFEAGQSRAYVRASGWQRTYLLWTFRNFRGVPHKILSARQRMMVEAHYPAASIHLGPEIDQETVIGTVEDFVPPFPVSTAIKEPVSTIPVMTLERGSGAVSWVLRRADPYSQHWSGGCRRRGCDLATVAKPPGCLRLNLWAPGYAAISCGKARRTRATKSNNSRDRSIPNRRTLPAFSSSSDR
jgi:hypothetical protein